MGSTQFIAIHFCMYEYPIRSLNLNQHTLVCSNVTKMDMLYNIPKYYKNWNWSKSQLFSIWPLINYIITIFVCLTPIKRYRKPKS